MFLQLGRLTSGSSHGVIAERDALLACQGERPHSPQYTPPVSRRALQNEEIFSNGFRPHDLWRGEKACFYLLAPTPTARSIACGS